MPRLNVVRHVLVAGLVAVACAGGGDAPVALDAGPAPADSAEQARRWVTPAVQAPHVHYRTFASASARATVSYHVYVPEAYHADTTLRLPVLYWLHGTGGGLGGIPTLSAWFDGAMRAGQLPPMLVVFPNGMASSMWADSKDGSVPMERVVVRDLVPHVDATMRTVSSRAGRILEGFSMGGHGAARIGLRHPELFGAVSLLGAGPLDLDFTGPRATANPAERAAILRDVYGDDLAHYRAQSPITAAEAFAARGGPRPSLRLRVVVGDRDFTQPANAAFHQRLTSLGVPHDFTVLPGVGHETMAVLQGLGAANWAFYRAALGVE